MEVLPVEVWQARTAAHEQRADELTAAHRARRAAGQTHAVDDFLFTYYPTSPAKLRRWHPGVGTALVGEAPHADWRWYTAKEGAVTVDAAAFLEQRRDTVTFVQRLLSATLERPAFLGCFGMHEWAMVYRDADRRHAVPLRLGQAGTDAVVEAAQIGCSHFDAFRFFTGPARPLNRTQPTRETQVEQEQPGCLHAAMDCHKWATKLGPAVPGELALDCFALAHEVRTLDMQASPYDFAELGLSPVAVETPEGRAEYVARQRAFADRSNDLRRRLLDVCEQVVEHVPWGPTSARRS